jgi:hypothetical protein
MAAKRSDSGRKSGLSEASPHYHGHRERLRGRFRETGRCALFDHLVSAGEQRRRHTEAKRLGGLEVDHQLELDRLRDRQVGWLGPL